MEESTWFLIIVSICIAALIKSIISLTLFFRKSRKLDQVWSSLPPGPPTFPFLGNLVWLFLIRKPLSDVNSFLRPLKSRYGPIFTLQIRRRPLIFIASHSFAHRALVQNAAVFSDRPSLPPTSRIFNRTQLTVSTASYGPTWRQLRRNLTGEILNPSRVKSYSGARRRVLSSLIRHLFDELPERGSALIPRDHFQHAVYCLLSFMCFGEDLQDHQIKDIESVQRRTLSANSPFSFPALNLWPRLSKILFRKQWNSLIQIKKDQENVLIPLIRVRVEKRNEVSAYVDTLINLQLREGNRELDESEMVGLCSEFLNGGSDTTSTALQWIMANLVKHSQIQAKLYKEIVGVVGPPPNPRSSNVLMEVLQEEDLCKMPYLKAVVLEALRLHPPSHFVLPHQVTEDVELDGYTIPKTARVNIMIAEMGRDPEVWEESMEFKPERFLAEEEGREAFDITGGNEIKMIPFGAGRRMCPGYMLALLHLECFVANLIWFFEWMPVQGDDIDLSEKQEFTTVMKNPLRAHVSPRF